MFKLRVKPATSALLLVLILAASAATGRSQGVAEWLTITPVDEGFTVKFPAKPDEDTDRVALMGNFYKSRLYTAVNPADGLVYMVVMQEFPSIAGVLKPGVRLDEFIGGFKEGMQKSLGTADTRIDLLPDRDIDLNGRAGRQLKLVFGETRGLVRAYDAGLRIYVVLVMGANENNASVVRFFDSFAIKPAPDPVPVPVTVTESKPS